MSPTAIELCVGIVAVDADRLLLIRRARPPGVGRWSIPGGHVEVGETMAEAAERELAEETGLTGRCGEPIGWVEPISRSRHLVIVDFWVHIDDPSGPVAGDDAAEVAWVPVDRVADLDLVDGLRRFLAAHRVLGG